MATLQLSGLTLGQELGGGGFAKVHDLPGFTLSGEQGPFVFKRYHARVLAKYPGIGPTQASLMAMRRQLTDMKRRQLDSRLKWPLAIVQDGGAFAGLVLSRIADGFFVELVMTRGNRRRLVRTAEMYFCSPTSSDANGLEPFALADRIMFVARFGQQLEFLHGLGITVGDIQGGNAAVDVNRGSRGGPRLCMYDCDSYRLRGSVPAIPQAHAMSWEPPELRSLRIHAGRLPEGDPQRALVLAQAQVQNPSTDVYKFGLFAIRMLSLVDGVSVSNDPSAAAHQLGNPQILGQRRTGALLATVSPDPRNRPTMTEVMASLTAA